MDFLHPRAVAPRRAVHLLGAGFLTAVAVSGCALRPVACSSASDTPLVRLDVSVWARSHPGTTVRVCAGRRCEIYRGGTAAPLMLAVQEGHPSDPSRPVPVTVTAARGGRQVLRVGTQVRFVRHTESGPCRSAPWTSPMLVLTADGRLQPPR